MILMDEFEIINQEWIGECFTDLTEEIDDFTELQLNELKNIGLNPVLKTKVIHQILRISDNLKAFGAQKQILIENMGFLSSLNDEIDPSELAEVLK